MKHRLKFLFVASAALVVPSMLCASEAPKQCYLGSTIYNYRADMVSYFAQQNYDLRYEFHTNEGELYESRFETDTFLSMSICGQTDIFIEPGDSLVVEIRYGDRAPESVTFTGSQRAVKQNRLLQSIESRRRALRFKSQLLACAVVQVKPADRIADSKKMLEFVKTILDNNREQISDDFYTYTLSSFEAAAYSSMIEYPLIYQEVQKTPIAEQGLETDYWTLMDGVTLRSDRAAMLNPQYSALLMQYMLYVNRRDAQKNGTEYTIPGTLETIYTAIAEFYDGTQRESALFTMLCNYIFNGKEIERVEPLVEDFDKNYNTEPVFAAQLERMMR